MARHNLECKLFDPPCPTCPGCEHRKAVGKYVDIACRCKWHEWIALHQERWLDVAELVQSFEQSEVAGEAQLGLAIGDEDLLLSCCIVAVRDYDASRYPDVSLHAYARVLIRLEQRRKSYRHATVSIDDVEELADMCVRYAEQTEHDKLLDARDVIEQAAFDELDSLILHMRFEQKMTMQAIGDVMGIGKSRVHAIITKLLNRLRAIMGEPLE